MSPIGVRLVNGRGTLALYSRFPRLFRLRYLPAAARMALGFECGDGWRALVSELAIAITEHARGAGLDHAIVAVRRVRGALSVRVRGGMCTSGACAQAPEKSLLRYAKRVVDRARLLHDRPGHARAAAGTKLRSKSVILPRLRFQTVRRYTVDGARLGYRADAAHLWEVG